MNQTAKNIQRVLMCIASLLNALLPILHVSKYNIAPEFIVGVNLVCSVLLAIACKPITELNNALVESVNALISTVSAQNSSRTEATNQPFDLPVEVCVDIPSPDAPRNEPMEEDTNIVQMNAYYNKTTCDIEITPRI